VFHKRKKVNDHRSQNVHFWVKHSINMSPLSKQQSLWQEENTI